MWSFCLASDAHPALTPRSRDHHPPTQTPTQTHKHPQTPTNTHKPTEHTTIPTCTQVAELVRGGYADVKPGAMKRLSMRYPVLEAEVVFAVQQVGWRGRGGGWLIR